MTSRYYLIRPCSQVSEIYEFISLCRLPELHVTNPFIVIGNVWNLSRACLFSIAKQLIMVAKLLLFDSDHVFCPCTFRGQDLAHRLHLEDCTWASRHRSAGFGSPWSVPREGAHDSV